MTTRGELTNEQVQLVKNTIAKGASDSELKLFIATANRMRLDPFARQIFLVKRWDSQVNGYVATPQVSIDGFRLVAERTGGYRGQTAPEWCGKDGKWVDVWLQDEPPAAARVGVHREGFAEPLVRVALYKSYVQVAKGKNGAPDRPNAMWAKFPEVMLAKCAESLALRSAFPNELSGVYTDSELPEQEYEVAPLPRQTTEARMEAIAAQGAPAAGPLAERGGPTSEVSTSARASEVAPMAPRTVVDSQSRAESTMRTTSADPKAGVGAHAGRPFASGTSAPNTELVSTGAGDAPPVTWATGTMSNTASSATTDPETGEVVDAKAWRARYEAVVAEALAMGVKFMGEDDLGLPEPKFTIPTFSAKAKKHAGKRYDEVPPGFLREVIASAPDFGTAEIAKRLWVLRLVARHEILKEETGAENG